MNNQFKMIDLKKTRRKPFVSSFVVKHIVEEQPDLSHLTGHLAGEEYTEQDNQRLERYNAGDWCMIGIRAECEYLVPVDSVPPSAIIQTLSSGGLWGIESDSGEEYLKEIATEEIAQLKDYCKKLGIKYDKKTPLQIHRD